MIDKQGNTEVLQGFWTYSSKSCMLLACAFPEHDYYQPTFEISVENKK